MITYDMESLYDALSQMIKDKQIMTDEIAKDIMSCFFEEKLKNTQEVNKWVNNCSKLLKREI